MRRLTSKQKKYLDKLIPSYKEKGIILRTVEDLQNDHWETLEQLNNTEILWQEVNRYISDKEFEDGIR